jgi:TfoX/Sxy family transcriptional regulator of competence genes
MASDQQIVDYITQQMSGAGDVRSRKMFGDYTVYCDEKVVALVCDDQLFMKITDPGRDLVRSPEVGPPYPGAKDSFVIGRKDWEDADYLAELVRVTADALSKPKSKKKR